MRWIFYGLVVLLGLTTLANYLYQFLRKPEPPDPRYSPQDGTSFHGDGS